MRQSRILTAVIVFVVLLSVVANRSPVWTGSLPRTNVETSTSSILANVGVWNDGCQSANMTVANPVCSASGETLAPGTQVTIDINVTNAHLFNAYQFSVYYDPTNLTLSSYNVGQVNVPGESPMFNNPFIANTGGVFDNLTTPGAIRAEVVNLASPPGNGTVYGSGVLAYLTFNIKGFGVSPFALAAGTCCPAEGYGATVDDWTRLIYGHNFLDITTSDGYLQNNPEGKLGPVARFTWSPSNPLKGQSVLFNATGSYDADVYPHNNANVTKYVWSFGDGDTLGPTTSPTTSYTFRSVGIAFQGNFSVLLKVYNRDGLLGMVTHLVQVGCCPVSVTHLLSVSLATDKFSVLAGENLTVNVAVTNLGTTGERFNLTLTYGPPTVSLLTLLNQTVSSRFLQNVVAFESTINTSGLALGTYEIDASVTDPLTSPMTTTAKKTFMVISPPPNPTIKVFPSAGADGTKVTIHGSGFSQAGLVLVTFDDMGIGFTVAPTGSFNFSFNVPLALPGSHTIKAIDEFSGLQASTGFQVLPQPNGLIISLQTARVYFPGDTAIVYAIVETNGTIPSSGTTVQLTIVRPDGSTASLTPITTSNGLFKATYSIPSSGSVGTYALLATAHLGGSAANALGGFEVKPSWLSPRGQQTITGTVAILGLVGVSALFWRRGYFRREDGEKASHPENWYFGGEV